VPIAAVSASSNRACVTCPTVVTGETCSFLLERHSSDGTSVAGYLLVATEDYGMLVQRRIVVVISLQPLACLLSSFVDL
jgi:hypothetical protein